MIRETHLKNDSFVEFTAGVSSSIGFIQEQIKKGVKFEKAIKMAIDNGITESNYMKDLSGEDSLIKARILAKYLGIKLTESNFFSAPCNKEMIQENIKKGLTYMIKISDEKIVKLEWEKSHFSYGFSYQTKKGINNTRSSHSGGPMNAAKGMLDDLNEYLHNFDEVLNG